MNENEIIESSINQKRWAVVGASEKPHRYSYKIVDLLMQRGYTVYPVSPRAKEILGLTVYPSLEDLPETPDVVDMVVNPKVGIEAMKQIAAMNPKPKVWLQPGAESPEIHAFAKEKGIGIIDACILAVLAIKKDHRISE